MSRKPSDIAQFKLRIRESLRRQLERAAARNNNSINVEITNRLHASFAADNARALDEIVVDLDRIRQGFAALLGADKLAGDPEALGQAIALLEALRGRIVRPASSEVKTQRVRVINLMDELRSSARTEIEPAKRQRKKS
jgi:hypothetical protein